MAYSFVAANSQYIVGSYSSRTFAPLTLSVWYRRAATSSTIMGVVNLGRAGGSTQALRRRQALDTSASNAQTLNATSFNGTTTATSTSPANSETLNAYNNGVGVFAAASRQATLNNQAGTADTAAVNPTDLAFLYISGIALAAVGNFLNGQAAEVAVWEVELTADEVASLSKGFKPSRIRPQSLLYYAPLIRDLNEVRSGLALTNTNSATVADHPRVY
jgi:hypothetical protein